jgi:hypothetical protein
MKEGNWFIEKGSFYYSPPPKYTRMCVSKKNPHLQKYQKQPLDICPFYSRIDSYNRLTTLDILTLVSRFVLLTVSLHFDLFTYLLFCQVAL